MAIDCVVGKFDNAAHLAGPTVSPGVCSSGIGSLAANRYGLDGYTDGDIPNPSDPSVKPAWDGTFPDYLDGADDGPNPGVFGWAAGGSGVHGISVAGNKACSCRLLLTDCTDDVPTWTLVISDIDDQPIWEGTKTGGDTPEGDYTLSGGVDVSPSTLTVVLVDATATPTDHGYSCVS